MKSFFSSFRFRLLVAIVASGLLPLCVSLFVFLQNRPQFRAPTFERLNGMADQVNELILQHSRNGLWHLRILEKNIPDLQRALSEANAVEPVVGIFNSLIKSSAYYAAAALFDNSGHLVATNTLRYDARKLAAPARAFQIKDFSWMQVLLEHQQKDPTSEEVIVTTTNDPLLRGLYQEDRPAVVLARFVKDCQGKNIGFFVLFLDLALFQKRLQGSMENLAKSGLGGGFILVLDPVTEKPLAYVVSDLSMDVVKIGRYFALNRGFLDSMDEVTFPQGKFAFGKKISHARADSSTPVWESYVCVPSDAAFRTYTETLWITLGLSGIGIILVAILAWMVGSFLARPILRLKEVMQTMKNRAFAAEEIPDQNRSDEIGELARTFAQMSSDLAEAQQSLYREIKESHAAKEAAQSANKAKSLFLATMSHELRTPINAIIGYAEILIEEAEENETDWGLQDLEKIGSSGRHLLGMIENIIDVSNLDRGALRVEMRAFDLAAAAKESFSNAQKSFEQRGNTLVTQVPEKLEILSDPLRVRQIIDILLSNAAKFSENSEVRVSVERLQDKAPPVVKISVKDHGIGMSEEVVARCFDEFYQADISSTRQYGGAGLGLTLAKAYTEALGGSVSVESAPGEGSTFTVLLPEQPLAPSAGSA